jgi:energy-coupling factor transporter transmembrane protein EcfT
MHIGFHWSRLAVRLLWFHAFFFGCLYTNNGVFFFFFFFFFFFELAATRARILYISLKSVSPRIGVLFLVATTVVKDSPILTRILEFTLIKLLPQSEYTAARDHRRAYVSNFSGSAGTALVTRDRALMWTDGRYYLQATNVSCPSHLSHPIVHYCIMLDSFVISFLSSCPTS